MMFCEHTTLCLRKTLIATKGTYRAQQSEKAVPLPKKSINIFDVSKGGWGSREKLKIDVSCGQTPYVRLP